MLEILRSKSGDEEIVLQILFCFHRMMGDPELGGELIYRIGISTDVAELLGHRNPEICRIAEEVGKLIIDHDLSEGSGEFADMIKQHRFDMHNREWLTSQMDDDFSKSGYSDDDYGYSQEMKNLESPKSYDVSPEVTGVWKRGMKMDVSSLETDRWDDSVPREWGVESPSEDDDSYLRDHGGDHK